MARFCCYTVFLVCLFPIFALGEVLELYVRESIDVYKKPGSDKRISQLDQGDRVIISPYIYDGFRKILITYRGKKRSGYIAIKDIVKSVIQSKRKRLTDYGLYRNRKALGISTIVSHSQRGNQTLETKDGNIYEIGELKNLGTHFALYGQYPLSYKKALDTSLSFYSTTTSGMVHLEGNEHHSKEIDIIESHIGLKGLLKFYSQKSLSFWYGPTLDLILRQSVEFKIENTVIGAKDESSEFFAIIGGAIGWDIHIVNSIYLVPELKLGFSVNRDPSSINGELSLKTAWVF